MNINQDPLKDVGDNFRDDGANNPRGGGIQKPRTQFPLQEMKEIIALLIPRQDH